MAETSLNKKMRAFDDEVALTIAPFYLVRMLQRKKPRVRGRDAGEGGGLELEHGRTSTISPSLVPHLQ
jgi:hypothetical protein